MPRTYDHAQVDQDADPGISPVIVQMRQPSAPGGPHTPECNDREICEHVARRIEVLLRHGFYDKAHAAIDEMANQ